MKPGDKVYVTKYALSKDCGVLLRKVRILSGRDVAVASLGRWLEPGRDVHATWPEALAAAEQMRTKKIAALRRQIERLEKLEFKEPTCPTASR